MITGDLLTSKRDISCDFTYLFSCDHGYNIHPLFPDHLPEVMARVWQRPLGSNVVPLLSTYRNLGVTETNQQTPKHHSQCPNSHQCLCQNYLLNKREHNKIFPPLFFRFCWTFWTKNHPVDMKNLTNLSHFLIPINIRHWPKCHLFVLQLAIATGS